MRELKKPYGDSLILGYSKENILKVISIIEKFMPPDDYILTYKDFLKHKDFMIYIGFNIKVYESLVNLIYELWDSGKRINRLYLLTILKRYNKKNPHPGDINEETASRLFHIFKQIIFIQNCKNNIKTYEKLKISINSVMLDVKLNENQLAWMCDKTETSDIIIKRTLWYKYKSDAISQWAINNYNKDYLRKYRAELTGWILDKDNTLVVEPQTLIDDFEYANKLDMQLIQSSSPKFPVKSKNGYAA